LVLHRDGRLRLHGLLQPVYGLPHHDPPEVGLGQDPGVNRHLAAGDVASRHVIGRQAHLLS